jgi:hypothetical protein
MKESFSSIYSEILTAALNKQIKIGKVLPVLWPATSTAGRNEPISLIHQINCTQKTLPNNALHVPWYRIMKAYPGRKVGFL